MIDADISNSALKLFWGPFDKSYCIYDLIKEGNFSIRDKIVVLSKSLLLRGFTGVAIELFGVLYNWVTTVLVTTRI